MQFKIPKFGFKFKKRGNAAGFFGAKLSIISNHLSIINDKLFQNNHLSIISNKLSQNNHLSIINDKLSKKRINYKLSIFGKKIFINYKLLIAVGVLALAATGGTLALNGFFGGGAAIPEDTMTRGLVGYWSFDEGDGTIARDASGNNNHGTLTNGPQWTKGKNGTALQFDGKDDYVNIVSDPSLILASGGSAEAWVKIGSFSSGFDNAILMKGDGASWSNLHYALLENTGGNKIIFTVSDGTNFLGSSGPQTPTLTANRWYHIIATWDNNQKCIYLDGVLSQCVSSAIMPKDTILSCSTNIGRAYHAGVLSTYYFNGSIDNIRIYNRALTEAEVKYHYNRGGPVAQWDMDEGSGSVINDKSGNGNDGTISGATWAQGKHGSALSFDGVDDYASVIHSSSISPRGDYTYSGWFYPRNNNSAFFILKNGEYGVQWRGSTSKIAYYEAPTYNLSTRSSWDINTWYYFSVVRNGSDLKLYIDGNLDSVSPASSKSFFNAPLEFGKFQSAYFNGSIDEVKIYDYARTEEEIRLDYNAGVATHLGPSGKTCSEDPASCMDFGLAGHWDMDEGSGTKLNDKSGNNNHGTLANGPQWTKGKNGGALQFDGKNDYVDAGNNLTLQPASTVTLEYWMYPRKFSNGINERSVVGWRSIDKGIYTNLWNSYLYAQFWDGSAWQDIFFTLPSLNQWYHIVITYDASGGSNNYKIYSNGILKNQTTKIGNIVYTGGYFSIGNNTTIPFDGILDEIRLYNRALSAEEVRYHYNQGKPVGYWAMDEGSGAAIKDQSGNGNDGTISGATWTQGKHGSALSFDGVDDYAETTSFPSLRSNDFTMSAWINTNAPSVTQGIISDGSGTGSTDYSIRVHNGVIVFSTWDGASRELIGIKSIEAGTWYHIAVVWDKDMKKSIYVNGLLDTSTEEYVNITGDETGLRIGKFSYSYPHYFDGQIDEVKIYDYARTEEEIRLDYNAGLATHLGPSGKTCSEDPAGCMDYGLAGHWDMDEGSGSILNDKSGNNNHGTLTNGPKWTKGKSGGALQFDGKDDYVNIVSDPSLILASGGSAEAWIKIGSFSSGFDNAILMKGDGASWPNLHYALLKNNGENKIIFSVSDGTNALGNGGPKTPTLSANRWYHIVATWDDSQKCIYLDGILSRCVSSAIMPKDTILSCSTNIGRAYHPAGLDTYYFSGSIDNMRIYNRALSEEEVRYHYNQGKPVGYWAFDEGEGTRAFDVSGNNNTGVLTNGPTWAQGKHGSALSFDGVDDSVDVANDSSLGITSNLTIEAWVNPSAITLPSGTWMSIAGKKDGHNLSGYGLVMGSYSPCRRWCFVVDNSGVCPANACEQIGRWDHLVGVYDGSKMYLYQNGILQSTVVKSGNIGLSANSFKVASMTSYGKFNGLIDEVKVYNYARTAEQIMQDYNAGVAAHLK